MRGRRAAFLREHGFWDYTSPGAGGMEGYGPADYDLLLDDMRGAGMNSVVVMVKWLTTGYRSRLPFLDQHPDNPVTASDNAVLGRFLERAAAAGIRTWLGAVVSMYPASSIQVEPSMVISEMCGTPMPFPVGVFDADTPEVTTFAVAIFDELASLFPMAGGFLVELELADRAMAHRISLYDRWAEQNGRPHFAGLTHGITARNPDLSAWRDYTTASRIRVLRAVEESLRSKGFGGRLAVLCETGGGGYQVQQEVNLAMLKTACPDWVSVSYDPNYLKTQNRLGFMEMAVDEPKRAGLAAHYLPRGVMTWGARWPLELSLEQFWDAEIEDIARFRPDGAWWFGSGLGGVREGAHVSLARLRASGYPDGRAARRALIRRIGRSLPD
jgi:hypothetical protein